MIEQSFTYVGITFSSVLSLNRMAEDNCVTGKRALNSILASMCNFGQLPNTVFFKLFDIKVLPNLLYGAELWGFQTRTGIERIQKYACKRYICLNETRGPRGPWNAHLKVKIFKSSLFHCFIYNRQHLGV